MAPVRSAPRLAPIVGGLYGAETCLYLAAAIFGAQALVILLSPAVALARQPDMVGDGAGRAAGLLRSALGELPVIRLPVKPELDSRRRSSASRRRGSAG